MSKMLVSFYDWLIANPEAFEKGPGLFCGLHIALIVFLAAWLIGSYFLFRRFPKFTKGAILGMCIYMVVARVFRMILLVATGVNTWVEVLPFHLCHIMSFLLPLCVFCKWKKPLPAFLLYAFFGGVLTFIFGDYYKYNMLTFLDIESIILHIILPTVGVAFVAIKEVHMTILDMIIIPIMLICLVCWAELGNMLLGTNFMYIRENGLPFNMFPGAHFLWTYFVFLIIALASIYIPVLIVHHKNKKKTTAETKVETPAPAVEIVSEVQEKETPAIEKKEKKGGKKK